MPSTITSPSASDGPSSTPCVSIDSRRKQVTLVHPTPSRRRFGLTAPKMFSFDSVFTQDDPLAEVCSAALTDAVYSVVHGTDSCVLCFGHAKTSKSRTMLGSDTSVASLGVIPAAIAWLFRLIEEQKEATKTRFSVRVSAVEVFGHEEAFKDLLQETALEGDDHLAGPAPSSYLRDNSPSSKNRSVSASTNGNDNTPAARLSQVMDKLTEVRAPTAGHAAHLLDVALANRAQNSPISHTLLTLHVYQYKVEKNGAETEVSGGRSRLQLLYLGCGRYGSKELGQDQSSGSKSLSLANMANVLLGLLTGQRQLPHRESAVTQLLREGMTGNHAQPCIIAHASGQQQHYSETLQVIQLASKLHRLRRRRVGSSGGSSAGASSWNTSIGGTTSDSSTSSRGFRSRLSSRPRLGRSSFGASTTDYTSSSEQSCAGDTVIYLGGGASETEGSLGPRGLADGSVVHSADEWKKYASSGEEGTLQRSSSAGKTRLGRSLSQSETGGTLRPGGLIKRVTPRTNATAWPRAAAVRKGKEMVSSTEETWVDGPNAMVAKEQQSASALVAVEPPKDQVPPPAPPYFGVAHHIIPQNPVQAAEPPKVFVAPPTTEREEVAPKVVSNGSPTEVHIKEPTYASIDETKQSEQSSGSSSCSSSESTSGSSDNENDQERSLQLKSSGGNGASGGVSGGRGFAVLSDISERTEETEGGTSAPSSIAGGAHEERENTLLDMAIQQSNLMNEKGQDLHNDERTFSWCLNDTLSETPQISFLQSNYATPQLEHKTIGQQTCAQSIPSEASTPIHQPRIQTVQTPGYVEKCISTDSPAIEPRVIQLPTPCSDRSRQSPRRRKHSNTASSFDRVAAWVKDVSTDLGHVQDDQARQSPSRTPAQSQPESRSPSCHRSCCSRRHRSHRKRRQRKHHSHHHRHHENSCSKCAPDACALCEAEAEKYCSKACPKCYCCDEERAKRISELSNHDSSCSNLSRSEIPSKSHPATPVIDQSISRRTVSQKVSSASTSPLTMQRTVSFPWVQPQMTRSSTVHSTPCQSEQPKQAAYWSPVYTPQTPQIPPQQQAAPTQYYPWSLPTSPYLQNSMQNWTAQLPMPSSAASDLAHTTTQLQYAYPRRSSEAVDIGTPAHTSSSSTSALPQDVKKSRFFTLPSILCTLRRWHARRKEKRTKKALEVITVDNTPVIDDRRNMSMSSSASLPGAYSRGVFQRGPSSDQGIVGAPQCYNQYYNPTTTASMQTQHQMYPQMCAGDPSSFMNQMHQSLSTYRTSSRSVGMNNKDSRGDRGSSGYESYRQGMTGGGGPGGSSEVSSANTDSLDSCSSGCPQQQIQPCQYNLQKPQQQQLMYCPSQSYYPPNQHPMPYISHPMTSPGHQSYPGANQMQ